MDGKPRRPLLYLSPVIPALGGNGLAMRAGAVLRVLARDHAVTLVAVPLYPPLTGRLASELADLWDHVAVLSPPQRGANRLSRVMAYFVGRRNYDELLPPAL